MSPKYAYTPRLKGALLALLATLFLAGCMSEDDKRTSVDLDNAQVGEGEVFHGAEWATIKNLDPRGEQCIDCHGKNNDMSPYNSGVMAHNIGLQKNDTPESLGVSGLKITGVNIDEDSGQVTVTTNQTIPADANLTMTFAKLAPRVIHNRGHDWQNYFVSNALGFGENRTGAEKMMLKNGGVQPQTVPSPTVNGNEIVFSLNMGDGRSWGKHDFMVKSAYEDDTEVWEYKGVIGTKFGSGSWDIASHNFCNIANENANQISSENEYAYEEVGRNATTSHTSDKPVCWWPDGTHLTSGVFATTNNEVVVAYEPDYTHRVTIIIGGQPGFNTWFDFVPSVANGDKTPEDFTAGGTTLSGGSYINALTGEVTALDYIVSDGNRAPGGTVNNDTHGHQSLPAAREVVDVQSCNSCHDSLSMHGGSRATTQTCVTCHNPGNLQASSGRSVDFKQLIHRIHRGENLPSEYPAQFDRNGNPTHAGVKTFMQEGKSLVASHATDFTKVRFPQGPTPGQAAGITNCVKCHMGEKTKDMVQGLADEVGPNIDVQSKLKLAKVTPQGDNWLSVRSVNACQACHDSNVWLSDGESISAYNMHRNQDAGPTKDPSDPFFQLDKYMPFYTDAYSGTGFNWLGKKLDRNNDQGWVHNTDPANHSGRFTCGSAGGCHGNNAIETLNVLNVGDPTAIAGRGMTNAIQDVHLRLTRNFAFAERFEIRIDNPKIGGNGKFTADVRVVDKTSGSNIVINEEGDVGLVDLSEIKKANLAVRIGWMHDDSPDYNHSPVNGAGPFQVVPGAPFQGVVEWSNSGDGVLKADLATSRAAEWEKLGSNLASVKFTVFVSGQLQGAEGSGDPSYNLTAVNLDFKANGDLLVNGEGRRKVVDFSAGQGIDENRDRYAGWDKEHGANTQSCSSCHLQLTYHGSISNNVQACVTCHNPQRTDLRARGGELGEDGQYEESLDFKRLIHAIHSAPNKRIDPLHVGTSGNTRPSTVGEPVRGHSFPGVISNCKSCHIEDENSGKWTFDLTQLPEGMIGSTAITGDWENEEYAPDGSQHDFNNHLKMSPIASVCSSCHDAGYKTSDGRMNPDILDGGPYVGSHWWQMGGIAPGIVRPGNSPQSTTHQSGK